jgi:predicted nucleic acid-binding protein
VFIDANVPMLAAGRDDPRKSGCVEFLRKVALGKVAGATSSEVFQELLHRYLTGRDVEKGLMAYDQLRRLVHEVYPVEIDDVDRARGLAEKYPGATARDLLHVAVMERHRIKRIASYDEDFDEFREVDRVDPASL